VKILPDNPNLDHLRRQAKDLLAGLRDIDPATTLADAQGSLARQYGFPAWADLKAEVERLRGSAETADPALARELADRYGLGAVTGPLRSVARPDESGRQWSMTTDRGRWAVRTMDTWLPIVDIETEAALQEAAAAEGILLPKPVRGTGGAFVEHVAGHDWRAYHWQHSGPPLSAPAGSAVTRAVGEILATLHGLALPVDRVSPWHRYRLTDLSWRELADKARDEPWAADLSVLAELDAVGADAVPPPPVLSHNNLGPGNVRLGPGGALVVVGWHHAGGQPPAWELAEALRNWTIDPGGAVNTAGALAMVDGYRARAGAVPPLDLTSFLGAVNAFANYVSGQIEDALAAPGPFATRNMRHLLAHLPTRATLERLLDVVS
jgi:Ser/Thr protein kinase RdoA (MazF antagonist)